MAAIQSLCNVVTTVAYLAFMVGEYASGLRLFTAPIDFRPPEAQIVRTPAQRRRCLQAGAAFIWCTLAALQGTPAGDAATRAVLAAHMFIKPVEQLTGQVTSGSAVEFHTGRQTATSILRRPLLDHEDSPPSWRALESMHQWDRLLADSIVADISAGDELLAGWLERIQPLDTQTVPADLLERLPNFQDGRLDAVPLHPQQQPLRTPWLSLAPRQRPAPASAP